MAVDTPAKIAILGAGPIGLEAALYARYLGYEVEILQPHLESSPRERRRAVSVQWSRSLSTNSSPLGLRALAAQDESYRPPKADERLSELEWRERYVVPLSKTDLLADHIRQGLWPYAIGKVEIGKTYRGDGQYDRGAWDFRIHAFGHAKEEEIIVADIIFDCTGAYPIPIGHGGIAAIGETWRTYALWSTGDRPNLWVYPPDVLKEDLRHFVGATTLVVGDEPHAANSITSLVELAKTESATRVLWVTAPDREQRPTGPLELWGDDSSPTRQDHLALANELAVTHKIEWLPGTWVEEVRTHSPTQVLVRLSGEREVELIVDKIISATGNRPNWDFTRELQLDICPITDAPRPFSEYLLKRPSPYSVEYPAPGPEALITSEPNYYVLGSKSFGRMPGFLFQHGLRQIRDVFTIIGDRADLDLYAQMK